MNIRVMLSILCIGYVIKLSFKIWYDYNLSDVNLQDSLDFIYSWVHVIVKPVFPKRI